ncbi:uncharacterized protein LOC133179698 [Saccostrea echinata]|uniref:uncharacterized protein LOC133179698 n=1 Tax=Saccostrea echinata TaxID=191078 RepID=UPI002A7F0165|nr:uncharacterized protein LOC133179698 [Saccostrea echinata]
MTEQKKKHSLQTISAVNRHTGFSVFVFDDSSFTPPYGYGEKVYSHNPSTCPQVEMNITVNKVTQGIALYNSKNPPLDTNCTEYEPTFATIEICEVLVIENIALNMEYKGIASNSYPFVGKYAADKAVDGHLQEKSGEDTCSFTQAEVSKTAWWKFTLRRLANIAYLQIYFRKGTVNRHTGFSVFVFNESSYTPPSHNGAKVFTQNRLSCPSQEMRVDVNKLAKGIAIFNSKDPPLSTSCEGYEPSFATTEVCEVMVMGCKSHHYGEPCVSCSTKCLNRQCDVDDGSCIYGCSARFMNPPGCSICNIGYYGQNCEHMCGKCKPGTYCNNITGICPNGCQNRWNGLKCDVCKNGYYDINCTRTCGHCKPGTYCHNITGICPEGCDDHWNGSQCDSMCNSENL